jgi:hypothetical protein
MLVASMVLRKVGLTDDDFISRLTLWLRACPPNDKTFLLPLVPGCSLGLNFDRRPS